MLTVAILAGGLATRLRPLTDGTPKSLVPVGGRPFIWHQLELLRRQGAQRIVLCLGHLGEQVQAAVGDGRALGLDIAHSFDGPTLLGTGGAIRRALPLLEPRFLVMYGDSYLPCPLERIAASFEHCPKPAMMTVLRNHGCWERSNVRLDGKHVEYDKHTPHADMSHVDFGLSAFSAEVFEPYADAVPLDLADVCRDLSREGRLAAYEVAERFYEIGSPGGIRDLEAHLAQAADGAAERGAAPHLADTAADGYAARHLAETAAIAARIDAAAVERLAAALAEVKQRGGRAFFIGVGGSAANCSHAVNDFRKLVGLESYTPTDNVAELTARVNDEGWESTFVEWLKVSRLRLGDAVFVLSVGGGDAERNVSANLVAAVRHARAVGAAVLGIVGRDGGYTARHADACVVIPTLNPDTVTPHAEAFQAVIWHLLVSHPRLRPARPKWESLERR